MSCHGESNVPFLFNESRLREFGFGGIEYLDDHSEELLLMLNVTRRHCFDFVNSNQIRILTFVDQVLSHREMQTVAEIDAL